MFLFVQCLEAERAGRGRGKVGERSGRGRGAILGRIFTFVFNVHDLVEFSRVHCCSVIVMQQVCFFVSCELMRCFIAFEIST